MQREQPALPLDGVLGEVGALADFNASASIERGLDGQFRIVLWFAAPGAKRVLCGCREFWMEWWLGQAYWLRFTFAGVRLNRAVFEAVKVRPATDPAQRSAAFRGFLQCLVSSRFRPANELRLLLFRQR